MTATSEGHVWFVGASMSVSETLRDVLSSRGMALRTAGSSIARGASPAAADCALFVVEIDGSKPQELQHVARLSRSYPQIPVLALIDRGNIPLAVEAMRRGADNCLEKPVDVGEIGAAMSLLNES
jgi:DNA-binding NtrC family response regulator